MSKELDHDHNCHKLCPKCNASNVVWVLNYYYCHTCWLKNEHKQTIIIEEKPKRKNTKRIKK